MPISNLGNGLRTGVCTSTNRPTTPYEGQVIYETDTDNMYVWSGTAWVLLPPTASPTFTGVPAAPTATAGTNTTQLATTAFANAAGGLVYVTSATVGTTVSSVAVASCFSATYENYKITYSGGASSTASVIDFTLTGSTLGHYAVMLYNAYATGIGATVLSNNRANWTHAGGGAVSTPNMNVEIQMPFLAKPTFMVGNYNDGTNTGMITGYQSQTISFTGFSIAPSAGTFTGGTITIYGYRKA